MSTSAKMKGGVGTNNLQYRLGRLDNLIKAEFDLVSYRMSWLVISQSFLFAAFSVAAANTEKHLVLKAMLWVLPVAGILISFIVWLAIRAAHSVVKNLKIERRPLELTAHEEFGCEIASVDTDRWEHLAGNLAPTAVPLIILMAWTALLAIVSWSALK